MKIELEPQLYYQFTNPLENRLRTQLFNRIRDQLYNRLWDTLWDGIQFRRNILYTVRNKIEELK